MTSDARDQVARVMAESDTPADASREQPLQPDLPPDRTRQFRHTSFSRMRTDWIGDDAITRARISAKAEEIIQAHFKVAYWVMAEIHKHVRKPLADANGEFRTYSDGTPMWECDDLGIPVEDWGLLDNTLRSDLLYVIVTHMFEWEQDAAMFWADAMFAKVQWEEAFSGAFIHMPGSQLSGRPTIDDKTQHGHNYSAQERYFAVFQSALSRRAEALVKSMDRLRWLLEKTTIA